MGKNQKRKKQNQYKAGLRRVRVKTTRSSRNLVVSVTYDRSYRVPPWHGTSLSISKQYLQLASMRSVLSSRFPKSLLRLYGGKRLYIWSCASAISDYISQSSSEYKGGGSGRKLDATSGWRICGESKGFLSCSCSCPVMYSPVSGKVAFFFL